MPLACLRLLTQLCVAPARMGLAATALAVLQYGPQIALTWSEGFVGALSIPTMAIQVPGSVAFVVSIAIREGTTWSCVCSGPYLPAALG